MWVIMQMRDDDHLKIIIFILSANGGQIQSRGLISSPYLPSPNGCVTFFSNRQARVQINGEQGRPVPLGQGLPQGSVLPPLLFLLYINDLKAVVPNGIEVAMFADDVSLLCRPNIRIQPWVNALLNRRLSMESDSKARFLQQKNKMTECRHSLNILNE